MDHHTGHVGFCRDGILNAALCKARDVGLGKSHFSGCLD